MSAKTVLIAVSFVASSALAFSALAAETVPAIPGTQAETASVTAPAAEPGQKATPHSHVQDKLGVAWAPPAEPSKKEPPSKKLHFHPRDGK